MADPSTAAGSGTGGTRRSQRARRARRVRPVEAVEAQPGRQPADGANATARVDFDKPASPLRPLRPAERPRALERRFRQTVKTVDLWSVLKISLCFYLSALIVALGAGIVMWWVGRQAGVIGGVENFMADLVSSPDFEFLSWRILRATTLIGLVLVSLMVVITVLAAAIYNVFSELIGGVEITVTEEEAGRR
jgi:hypothetical protein